MIFDSIKPNTRYLKNHIGFSQQVGRRQYGLNSLCVAAAIMAVLDPQVIWDVGFQLSFAATLGLILYADRFTNTFKSLAARWLSPGLVERRAGRSRWGKAGSRSSWERMPEYVC
ncbi:MAG TPA: ComEC/Rec2 family competence protein [Anaerolineales bacterium]